MGGRIHLCPVVLQVTLSDPIWQVALRSCATGFLMNGDVRDDFRRLILYATL